MKFIYTIFLLFVLNPISLAQELFETYIVNGFNSTIKLELYKDDSFIFKYSAMACTDKHDGTPNLMSEEIQGKYSINNNKIHFTPEKKFHKRYKDKEAQLSNLTIQESQLFVFNYDIIEYKDTKFLFKNKEEINFQQHSFYRSDNHYILLANWINATSKSTYIPSEYWRLSTSKKEARIVEKDIVEAFPEAYKDYILKEPITGEIQRIEEVSFINQKLEYDPKWKQYRISLNVGKKDGVKPLMFFYGEKGTMKNQPMLMVVDVFENKCTGYIGVYSNSFTLPIKQKFSTRKEEEEN